MLIIYILYFLLTIVMFPLILIIDIVLNFKREDFFIFLKKRYIDIFVSKNINNNSSCTLVIATSAGEVNFFKKIYGFLNKSYKNIFIYTTSYTGKCILEKNNIQSFNYLPPENIIYSLLVFLKYKPKKILFIEHEIWPTYVFLSKIFGVKTIYIQAKASKSIFLNKVLYSNIDVISPINTNHEKEFKKRVKTSILKGVNYKVLPTEFDNKKINKANFVVFASTHKEEESYFFLLIKKLLSNNILPILVPRHTNRIDQIKKELKLRNINYKLFSDIVDITNYKFENKLVLVDKFGVLKEIYEISKITFIGATFYDYNGGHNIYEPLSYLNYVISGKYLRFLCDLKNYSINNDLMSEVDNIELRKDEFLNFIIKIISNYNKLNFKKLNYFEKQIIENLKQLVKLL